MRSLIISVMPGTTLNHQYNFHYRGGLESSLILNRVSAGLNGVSTSSGSSSASGGVNVDQMLKTGVDTALLTLELKRHERKRHMLRYVREILISVAKIHGTGGWGWWAERGDILGDFRTCKNLFPP